MSMVGKGLLRTLADKAGYAVIRRKRADIVETGGIIIGEGGACSSETDMTKTTMPKGRSEGNQRENSGEGRVREIDKRRQWIRKHSRWRRGRKKKITMKKRKTMMN